MRSIDIKVHYVLNAGSTIPDVVFPANDIQVLYRTAGVDISFVTGTSVDRDPNVSAVISYEKLVAGFRKTDRSSGHIFVGLLPPEERPAIAGELLDLQSRGAAVVYTTSTYVLTNPRLGLLQAAAHEIGHMLNLGHNDTAHGHGTTMNQSPARPTDSVGIRAAWQLELNDGSHNPTFLVPPSRNIDCPPLAYAARNQLNTMSDDQLRPWGSAFNHGLDSIDDSTS